MSLDAKRTLVFAILKFLKSEINQENVNADIKESLEVASQCLESCYEISVDDEICKNNFDSGLDLVGIAEKSIVKKELSEELKEKANTFKNDGNELMKQEKFKEALDCYNKAIEIDKSNAVFYCNRAAAYSKLNDYANSIEDCKTALKIDPTYSKAWGRLGLAFLSNNQNEEAYEAYTKAIQLEPNNDGYKQNLKIVEEKLKSTRQQGGLGDVAGMGGFMNMFNNPEFLNMATQLMNDPQMQNLMSNVLGGMGSAAGGGGVGGVGGSAQPQPNAGAGAGASANPFAAGGLPFGDMNALLQAGQRFAQQIHQMNPQVVDQLRQGANPNSTNPPSSDNANNTENKDNNNTQ